MKKLFWLNACRVETTRIIINTDITIELKIINKVNSSRTQVTIPLLFMLSLNKKLSFIQHLYFGRNNDVIKTANKISIMTLVIKGHGNCKVNWFLKFHKSGIKMLVIMNFIKKNLTLRFPHKSKIIWNIQEQKRIMKHKVLPLQKLNAQTSIQLWCIDVKILNLIDTFLFQDFF